MKLKYKHLKELPMDFSEGEVRICSSQYEEISGSKVEVSRLKPWKARVVSVSSKSGTVYRLMKGHGSLSIVAGICWIGPKTRSQLDIHRDSDVEISAVSNQWLARFLYYNNHLEDAVRFSFRIGFWGLILAVLSLGLSLTSILKT